MTLASFNNTLAVTVDQNLNPNLALPKKGANYRYLLEITDDYRHLSSNF